MSHLAVYPEGIEERIHDPLVCEGTFCLFHNPSDHHMVDWPIVVRTDRFLALCERQCPHGIGHPDPDSLAFVESKHEPEDRGYEGVHGCDGCCVRPSDQPVGRSPQPVEVRWLDSGMSLAEGWESTQDHLARASLSKMEVVTVGLLMQQNEDVVLVGLSYDPDNKNFFGAQVIARQNVISMRSLA